jgi:hypothetical protein
LDRGFAENRPHYGNRTAAYSRQTVGNKGFCRSGNLTSFPQINQTGVSVTVPVRSPHCPAQPIRLGRSSRSPLILLPMPKPASARPPSRGPILGQACYADRVAPTGPRCTIFARPCRRRRRQRRICRVDPTPPQSAGQGARWSHRTCKCTRTYCPGRSMNFGFGAVARAVIVPVVRSTPLSTKVSSHAQAPAKLRSMLLSLFRKRRI